MPRVTQSLLTLRNFVTSYGGQIGSFFEQDDGTDHGPKGKGKGQKKGKEYKPFKDYWDFSEKEIPEWEPIPDEGPPPETPTTGDRSEEGKDANPGAKSTPVGSKTASLGTGTTPEESKPTFFD